MEDTTYDQYTGQIEDIRKRLDMLEKERSDLNDEASRYPLDSDVRQSVKEKVFVIESERETLRAAREDLMNKREAARQYESEKYGRPVGRWANLVNKFLGPLPKRQRVIQPTAHVMNQAGSYRIAATVIALVLCAAVAVMLVATTWAQEGLFIRVALGFTDVTGSEELGSTIGMAVVVAVMYWLSWKATNPPTRGGWLENTLMYDALWFRTGAESWTFKERVYSVVAHVLTRPALLMFAVPTIVVSGTLATAALIVYLREYRRSGNTHQATLVSVKFHATFYRALAALAGIAVAAVVIVAAVI